VDGALIIPTNAHTLRITSPAGGFLWSSSIEFPQLYRFRRGGGHLGAAFEPLAISYQSGPRAYRPSLPAPSPLSNGLDRLEGLSQGLATGRPPLSTMIICSKVISCGRVVTAVG